MQPVSQTCLRPSKLSSAIPDRCANDLKLLPYQCMLNLRVATFTPCIANTLSHYAQTVARGDHGDDVNVKVYVWAISIMLNI